MDCFPQNDNCVLEAKVENRVLENTPSLSLDNCENRVWVPSWGEVWEQISSFPPTAGEGLEREENPQETESFGERWLRLYGSAIGNVGEETRFPGYMGAVPGSIGGGDFERVPSVLPTQEVQSSGILVVVEEGPLEAQHEGGGDTDLEVSPP